MNSVPQRDARSAARDLNMRIPLHSVRVRVAASRMAVCACIFLVLAVAQHEVAPFAAAEALLVSIAIFAAIRLIILCRHYQHICGCPERCVWTSATTITIRHGAKQWECDTALCEWFVGDSRWDVYSEALDETRFVFVRYARRYNFAVSCDPEDWGIWKDFFELTGVPFVGDKVYASSVMRWVRLYFIAAFGGGVWGVALGYAIGIMRGNVVELMLVLTLSGVASSVIVLAKGSASCRRQREDVYGELWHKLVAIVVCAWNGFAAYIASSDIAASAVAGCACILLVVCVRVYARVVKRECAAME